MKFVRSQTAATPDDSNLLPLVNVVFLLLVFLLLAGTLESTGKSRIEPALSVNANPDRSGELKLGLTKEGDLLFGGEPVSHAELVQLLRDRLPARVQILADRRAHSGDLQVLLQLLSRLGFEAVQLITQRSGS